MDIVLIILSGIFVFLGFVGCILPILPSIPLSYIGILLLHFTSKIQFSTQFLVIWGIIVLLAQLLDYFVPILGTKKFGGSKKGVWGSTLGMVIGLFFAPWGIVIGPFIGAIVGELMDGKTHIQAIRAGLGSFIGWMINTASKLIIAGFFIYYYFEALIKVY